MEMKKEKRLAVVVDVDDGDDAGDGRGNSW